MSYQARCRWIASVLVLAAFAFVAMQPARAQEPEAKPPADPYAVPDGDTEQLAEFIEKLLTTRPPDMESRMKAMAAMEIAAEKILAGKAEDSELEIAVRVKMLFSQSPEDLEALAAKLEKDGKPKFARMVQATLLRRRLDEAMRMSREEGTKQIRETIAQIQKFLPAGPIGREEVRLALHAAQMAEMTGDDQLVIDTYKSLVKLFSESDDEELAAVAEHLEATLRRVTLVGNPIKVEGTLLDGKTLDWASYRGKVVLVDFWATWCGPCLREVPNMLEAYKLYNPKGFEIVGISLDDTREPVEKFIEERGIPWTIVYDDGGNSPTAEYYGVSAIPTMVLVGKDGKVVSLSARGEMLFAELEKLLGPVEREEEKAEEGPIDTE